MSEYRIRPCKDVNMDSGTAKKGILKLKNLGPDSFEILDKDGAVMAVIHEGDTVTISGDFSK